MTTTINLQSQEVTKLQKRNPFWHTLIIKLLKTQVLRTRKTAELAAKPESERQDLHSRRTEPTQASHPLISTPSSRWTGTYTLSLKQKVKKISSEPMTGASN